MSELRYEMFRNMCGFTPFGVNLLNEIAKKKHYFLVADKDTPEESFRARNNRMMFLDGSKILPVFLEEDLAKSFAVKRGVVTGIGEPMVCKMRGTTLAKALKEYALGGVDCLRFLAAMPVYYDSPVRDWLDAVDALSPEPNVGKTKPDKNASAPEPTEAAAEGEGTPESTPFPEKLVGGDYIRIMLEGRDKEQLKDRPPYSYYEDFPELLRKLMEVNKVTAEMMDEHLKLPSGLTASVITTPKYDKLSKAVLCKYLALFGLESHFYRYASASSEVRRMLDTSKELKAYTITQATVNTERKWKIAAFEPTPDRNNAILYKITFCCEGVKNNIVAYTVSPVGYIDTRFYDVRKNAPDDAFTSEGEQKNADPESPPVSQEDKERENYKKSRRQTMGTVITERDKDVMKDRRNRGAVYNRLEKNDALYDEMFWTFFPGNKTALLADNEYKRRKEKHKPVEVDGYTAEKLAEKYGIDLWDAYMYIGRILEDHDAGWKLLKETCGKARE